MVVRASKEKATSLLVEQHSADRHLADENEIKSDLSTLCLLTQLKDHGSFVKAFWCLMSVGQMTVGQMPAGQIIVGQMTASQMLVRQIPVITNACRPDACWPNACWPNACWPNAWWPNTSRSNASHQNGFPPKVGAPKKRDNNWLVGFNV
jgi:hypothetical protein